MKWSLVVLSCLIGCLHSVTIRVDNKAKELQEGSTFTIVCSEESTDQVRVGKVQGLALETVHQRQRAQDKAESFRSNYFYREYINEIVVKSVVNLEETGRIVWGNSYVGNNRISVKGEIGSGNSTMSVTFKETLCSDGPKFLCVARGSGGTIDSQTHELLTYAMPSEVVIAGGRKYPKLTNSYRSHCDIQARPGELINLVCNARIGQPLMSNSALWYQGSGSQTRLLKGKRTLIKNSTMDSCSGELTTSLTYEYNPEKNGEDIVVTCSVQSVTYPTKNHQVMICPEAPQAYTFTYTQYHIIGIFFAGFGSMLVIAIFILLILCCCGCRCINRKKHNVDISESEKI